MFEAVFAAFLIGHYIGDYFVQTDHQAQHKGLTGARSGEGRWNAAAHAVTHMAAVAVVLAVVLDVEDVEADLRSVIVMAAALIANALTHYVIDRRWTLEAFARRIRKSGWIDSDPEALPKLDQAAHIVILGFISLAVGALM